MWVYVSPGEMQLTCTLCSETSAATLSTNRATAALVDAYRAKLGRPLDAPPQASTMIFPRRRSIMPGSAARQAFMTPTRLDWITSCQDLGELSTNGPMGPCSAAAQIRICTGLLK